MGDGRNRIVLDVADRRPIWAMPPWALAELREALPSNWRLHLVAASTDGSGDGGALPADAEAVEAVRGARVYIGFGIPSAVLEAGGDTLDWVHTGAAGVGSSLHEAMLQSRIRFTNSAGIHGPPMAETVLGMLLYFCRGFDFAATGKVRSTWNDAPFLAAESPVRELSSMTVGILGYGGIGREVGIRLRALGSRVIGLRRGNPAAAPKATSTTDEHGSLVLQGDDGLTRLLSESDALVLAAPETERTKGILSRERIRSMPKGSVLVNVARGSLVDEDALVEGLRDGHLRGVALDVFRTEPLPSDHPLWALPNVLITPHVSAVSHGFWRRQTDLIVENFRRLLSGEPMVNEVDRSRGY